MKRYRAVLAAFALLLFPVSGAASQTETLVEIERTEVAQTLVGHVVLLRVADKAIPIFVDPVVAQSIHGALSGEKFPRPLTHDLMRVILEEYGGRVSRVVISLKGATFYADLSVELQGTTRTFDSRSSDAIALAVHFRAPLLVSADLLEKAGKPIESPAAPPAPGETRL